MARKEMTANYLEAANNSHGFLCRGKCLSPWNEVRGILPHKGRRNVEFLDESPQGARAAHDLLSVAFSLVVFLAPENTQILQQKNGHWLLSYRGCEVVVLCLSLSQLTP